MNSTTQMMKESHDGVDGKMNIVKGLPIIFKMSSTKQKMEKRNDYVDDVVDDVADVDGTEAENQLPLKRSTRFQCLFPNPNWLMWKGIPPPKTRSNFPWDRQLPYGD